MHCTPGWWRVFLYLAYYLGLRRGELLGLTWEHVRFDTKEIMVHWATSKSRKTRILPLQDELIQVFQEWRSSQPTIRIAGEVLPWPHDSYRRLYDDWHAIQDAAGIEEHYVPHDCRSTIASLLNTHAPGAARGYLGHTSQATTDRYYINTAPALRAAAEVRKVKLA